jgi:hypothetical protein
MRDLISRLKVTQVRAPIVSTTSKTSTAVDLKDYRSAAVIFNMSNSVDVLSESLYWTLKAQHSNDNSSWDDCAIGDLQGVSSATVVVNSPSLDDTAYVFGYAGGRRYLRAQALATGMHSDGTVLAITILRSTSEISPPV